MILRRPRNGWLKVVISIASTVWILATVQHRSPSLPTGRRERESSNFPGSPSASVVGSASRKKQDVVTPPLPLLVSPLQCPVSEGILGEFAEEDLPEEGPRFPPYCPSSEHDTALEPVFCRPWCCRAFITRKVSHFLLFDSPCFPFLLLLLPYTIGLSSFSFSSFWWGVITSVGRLRGSLMISMIVLLSWVFSMIILWGCCFSWTGPNKVDQGFRCTLSRITAPNVSRNQNVSRALFCFQVRRLKK